LLLGRGRKGVQLLLQRTQLEKLTLVIQLVPLSLSRLGLLLGQLLRQESLLALEHLEVLLNSHHLLVVLSCLLLGLHGLLLARLHCLLQLFLRSHQQLDIILFPLQLALESVGSGTDSLRIALLRHVLHPHLLHLALQVLDLRAQPPVVASQVGLFPQRPLQVRLQSAHALLQESRMLAVLRRLRVRLLYECCRYGQVTLEVRIPALLGVQLLSQTV
jgi:hypothetical protein